MTNFLSPVDPVFFLHHANIDRLWDVWIRKQKRLNLPYLPKGQDMEALSNEPFLFYVNGKGEYLTDGHAGDYLSMEKFDYEYEPGFGEKVVGAPSNNLMTMAHPAAPSKGILKGNTASLALSAEAIKNHLASTLGASLVAEVTLPRPNALSSAREFDVLVGAPADVSQVDAHSPYYAGTIAFFGKMMNMAGMPADATFTVPLPKAPEAFHNFAAVTNAPVSIRIVPAQGHGEKAPALKAVTIRAR
jgi:tyrosinase